MDSDTCPLRPGGKCFTVYEQYYDEEKKDFLVERRYGCLPPDGPFLQVTFVSLFDISRVILHTCIFREKFLVRK